MKSTSLILSFLLMTTLLFSQTWSLDKGHSKVGFTVKHHYISEVDGNFMEYDAKITTSKEDFSDAQFEFTAKSASLTTFLEMRDNHLKSPDIFDVEKYPEITFKNTSFERVMGNEWKLTGDLTMKGKTLPVTMDVVIGGPEMNERAKTLEIGIKAIGKINRLDFGVGENLPFSSVGNEIQLRILGEFRKD